MKNEPFIQNIPYIRTSVMVCCPKCGYNCSKGTGFLGEHLISELLIPPSHEPKFCCLSCRLKFDFVVTLDRQEEIREGLSAMKDGEIYFEKSIACFKQAERLIMHSKLNPSPDKVSESLEEEKDTCK